MGPFGISQKGPAEELLVPRRKMTLRLEFDQFEQDYLQCCRPMQSLAFVGGARHLLADELLTYQQEELRAQHHTGCRVRWPPLC